MRKEIVKKINNKLQELGIDPIPEDEKCFRAFLAGRLIDAFVVQGSINTKDFKEVWLLLGNEPNIFENETGIRINKREELPCFVEPDEVSVFKDGSLICVVKKVLLMDTLNLLKFIYPESVFDVIDSNQYPLNFLSF